MKKNELIAKLLDRKLASVSRDLCFAATANRNLCFAATANRNLCFAAVEQRLARAASPK